MLSRRSKPMPTTAVCSGDRLESRDRCWGRAWRGQRVWPVVERRPAPWGRAGEKPRQVWGLLSAKRWRPALRRQCPCCWGGLRWRRLYLQPQGLLRHRRRGAAGARPGPRGPGGLVTKRGTSRRAATRAQSAQKVALGRWSSKRARSIRTATIMAEPWAPMRRRVIIMSSPPGLGREAQLRSRRPRPRR